MTRINLFKNLIFLEANIFLLYPIFFTSISILKGEKITFNLLLFILFFGAVFIFSYLILNLIKNKKVILFIDNLIKFLLIYFLLNCFFFPLSIQDGLVDPTSIGINKLNFIMSFLLSLLLFYFLKNKFKFFFNFNLVVSILVIIFFSYVYFIENKKSSLDTEANLKSIENFKTGIEFGNKNILFLSFDGINPHLVYENIKNNHHFKDFEFFHNTFSQSPATFLSMSGELFGNLNFKSFGKNDNDLRKNLPYENILINKKKNINIFTYAGYNEFNLNQNSRLPYIFNKIKNNSNTFINLEIKNTLKIYNFTFARIATRYSAKTFDNSIKFLIKLFIDDRKFKNYDLLSKLFFHQGRDFDVNLIPTIIDFEYLINNFSYSDSKKLNIKYFQFDFTHFPVDFNSECNYMSYDLEWFKSNQNQQGLINEIKCLFSMIDKFILRLKEENIYDNTYIVIKSDHGQPSYYFEEEPYNIRFNSHKSFGYSRYNATLMIKPFNTSRIKMENNYKTNSLNFLNKILCKDVIEYCNENNSNLEKKYQIYIPTDENSTYYLNQLNKVIFSSSGDLIKLK